MTALGNPNLLHMISRTIEELTHLFARFDRDGNGYISKVWLTSHMKRANTTLRPSLIVMFAL